MYKMNRGSRLLIVLLIIAACLGGYYSYKKSEKGDSYSMTDFWNDLKALLSFQNDDDTGDDSGGDTKGGDKKDKKDDNKGGSDSKGGDNKDGKGGDKPPTPPTPPTPVEKNIPFQKAFLRSANSGQCWNLKGGKYNEGDPVITYKGGDGDCEGDGNNIWSYDGNNLTIPDAGTNPPKCIYIDGDQVVLKPCRDYQSVIQPGWWNWNPTHPTFSSGQQRDMCLVETGDHVLKYTKCDPSAKTQQFNAFYGPGPNQHYNFST